MAAWILDATVDHWLSLTPSRAATVAALQPPNDSVNPGSPIMLRQLRGSSAPVPALVYTGLAETVIWCRPTRQTRAALTKHRRGVSNGNDEHAPVSTDQRRWDRRGGGCGRQQPEWVEHDTPGPKVHLRYIHTPSNYKMYISQTRLCFQQPWCREEADGHSSHRSANPSTGPATQNGAQKTTVWLKEKQSRGGRTDVEVCAQSTNSSCPSQPRSSVSSQRFMLR